jgi:hypothetical protein
MNKIQAWLWTKRLQAQGWSEKKATKAINKMSIHDQAKLSLLAVRAVGVIKYRQEFIIGFEKEFTDAVNDNPGITVEELTGKYFAEKRFIELLNKLSLTQHDIKELARKAIEKFKI